MHDESACLMRPTEPMRRGLAMLATRLPQGCTVVEIGSYLGESAQIFLDSGRVAHIYCVDPWQDGFDDREPSSRRGNMGWIERRFDERVKPYAGRFTKLKSTSADAAEHFPGVVDAVYIDGCHRYESVLNDLRLWGPKAGIVAGHDWLKPDVQQAVREVMGKPDELFEDWSWLVRW